jgi:DNA topoisomerase-3
MLKKDSYYILPDGEYLIESLSQLGIIMDKYKTSQMGQALKRVFHGEYSIEDSVSLAKKEIGEVFESSKDKTPEMDINIGVFGEVVGICPLCGGNVIRTKFGYGCSSYRENGCKFSINKSICKRVISVSNVKMLLATGKTSKIQGFTSKNGNSFDAVLKLDENSRVVFDFN